LIAAMSGATRADMSNPCSVANASVRRPSLAANASSSQAGVGGGSCRPAAATSITSRNNSAFVLITWSNLLGAAWVQLFGALILSKISLPIEQVLTVVWILGFGLAGAVVAYARRPRTAPA
jgi:hypothetical protein